MTTTTDTSTDPRAALPATLTTGLLERLTERVTASPDAPLDHHCPVHRFTTRRLPGLGPG